MNVFYQLFSSSNHGAPIVNITKIWTDSHRFVVQQDADDDLMEGVSKKQDPKSKTQLKTDINWPEGHLYR